jgi:uncharacterized protein (DUF2249 family)
MIMIPERIDIRVVPPVQRHALIFSTFDALPIDGAFEIINDHNPLPLRHQFEATRPGQCDWSVLEAGPALWQVRIRRQATGAPVADAAGCCACTCRGA